MKRLLTLAAMFLCCTAISFAQFSGSGSGTENDPYLILNPIQLNQMRNFLDRSGVYFKLMVNIDLSDFIEDEYPSKGWVPIGTASVPFRGIFDGNGNTISGLRIKMPNDDYIGLFGYNVGSIKNLTLSDVSIEGKNYVGGFCGFGGDYNGCKISGKIKGDSYVGGYCGNDGEFSNCVSKTDIDAIGNYVGGFCGKTGYGFNNCRLTCNEVKGNSYVGGLCGNIVSTTSTTSSNMVQASIVGTGYCVGGVFGEIRNDWKGERYSFNGPTYLNCGFIGTVSAESSAGGLSGRFVGNARMSGCFALGDVIIDGDYAGGLFGHTGKSGVYADYVTSPTISNCYYHGNIVGRDNIGGLVGSLFAGSLNKSYSKATISGNTIVGGICGNLYGDKFHNAQLSCNVSISKTINATGNEIGRIYGRKDNHTIIGSMGSKSENKSINRTVVILAGIVQEIIDNEQNGAGVSPTTLKLKATYVAMDWDFTDTWAIQETECYPYFKTQTAPPVITSQIISGATVVSGKCVDGGTITLEVDGTKQQMISTGNTFSFTVSPLQAGHEVRVSAKADGKEQSYFTTETVSYLGKGTESDPYQVYTAADLTGVYRKGYFKLMNDIDLTSYINQFSPSEGWQSIGRDGSETIHFDGNNHKITGLWCNSTRDNTGLFSCFANGTIKNLTVETASGKQVKGGANTGILIGKMINGTIENCKVSGRVSDGTPVGGMVGLLDGGSISRCQTNVSITTTGATSYVGGLVGEITGGTIDQCFTAGTLNSTGTESYVGGLIGKNYATITNSYSTAKVSSSYNAAGLVAYNYGMVDKCYATGDLFSNNYAAGAIGYNDGENAVVQNSAAMSNKIDLVYESQQVQQGGGYGQRIIGGIKNGAPAPEMNNYALKTMQVSVNDVPQRVYDDIMNGTAMTNEELMNKGTYSLIGWDFTNIWDIDAGISYPYLRDVVNSGETPDDPDEPIVSEDNALVLEDVTAAPGSQFVLPINMVNVDEVTALQFDLYLPSGVTIAEEEGELLIDLADRTTYRKHSLAFRQQADGAMRITCSSNNNATFTGNEGAIINVTLNVSSTIEEKEYVIAAKNIEISTKGGIAYNPADAKAKLSISSYLLGDADQSGKVSINDAVCIVNYILGFPNQTFLEAAADVDQNGHISINDKVVLINDYILGSDASSAKRFALSRGDVSTGYLYIDNLNMQAGETRQIEVKMQTNRTDIKALQCDIVLPRGLEFVYEEEDGERYYADKGGRAARSHSVVSSIQGDGSLRVVESNDNNDSFKDNDLPVFTFTIRAVSNMAEGSYSIMLSNVELSYGQSINPDDREVVLIIGNSSISTDINAVDKHNTSYDVYNMNGQMIRKGSDNSNLPRGIYIVNGKKVVVK